MKRASTMVLVVIIYSCTAWQCTTSEHKTELINIPGTSISLRPPHGFVLLKEMGGFKSNTNRATIIAMDLPKSFQEVTAQMMNGSPVFSKKVMISGKEALLCHVTKLQNNNDFSQWMLIAPNAEYTTIINGTFLKKDEATLSNAIQEALLSIEISDEPMPVELLPFKVSDSLVAFKPAKILPGPSIVYTRDGRWNEKSLQEYSFFVGQSIPQMVGMGTEEFCYKQFLKLCSSCKVDSSSVHNVFIDSLKGYELWGNSADKQRLKYQVILYDSNRYYLMVGTVAKDNSELQSFQKVSRTFRRVSLE